MVATTATRVFIFKHAFQLEGIDRDLPAGRYSVIYDPTAAADSPDAPGRRAAWLMPPEDGGGSVTMMIPVAMQALEAAMVRDGSGD